MTRRVWVLLAALAAASCGGSSTGGGLLDGGSDARGFGGSGAVGGSGASGGSGAVGGSGAAGGTGGSGGGCQIPESSSDGRYLLTVATNLDPAKPVLFLVDASFVLGPQGSALIFTAQALDARDRNTPVGMVYTFGPTSLLGGALDLALPPLLIDGAANPITLGNDIEVELALRGQLCEGNLFCGSASGRVTKPLAIDLSGSTWTLERINGAIPDPPKINCNGDPAGPPPSGPAPSP